MFIPFKGHLLHTLHWFNKRSRQESRFPSSSCACFSKLVRRKVMALLLTWFWHRFWRDSVRSTGLTVWPVTRRVELFTLLSQHGGNKPILIEWCGTPMFISCQANLVRHGLCLVPFTNPHWTIEYGDALDWTSWKFDWPGCDSQETWLWWWTEDRLSLEHFHCVDGHSEWVFFDTRCSYEEWTPETTRVNPRWSCHDRSGPRYYSFDNFVRWNPNVRMTMRRTGYIPDDWCQKK